MFRVRRYTSADEPAWLQCRLLALFGSAYYDDVKTAKTQLGPDSVELVAEFDDRLVGFIDVEVHGETATINSVAVTPVAQRAGIGGALVRAAIDLLPPTVRSIDAWAREHPVSDGWFEKSGFAENYRYLHVFRGESDPPFAGPEGMSVPVSALLHAAIDREDELRASYRRVYVCRQYLREIERDPASATP